MSIMFVNNCPVCGLETKNNNIVSTKGKKKSKVEIVQCKNCQLFYHRKYFNIESGAEYYSRGSCNAEIVPRSLTDLKPKIKKRQITKKILFDDWSKFRTGARCGSIIKDVRKGSKILDVGCRVGSGIIWLKENKQCIVEGVEPDYIFAKVLEKRNIKVHKQLFENVKFNKKNRYDIIILRTVIDHFYSPLQNFRRMYKLLNPGGYIFLVNTLVPDGLIKSINTKMEKDYIFQVTHFVYFNKTSLSYLLKLSGFNRNKIVDISRKNVIKKVNCKRVEQLKIYK